MVTGDGLDHVELRQGAYHDSVTLMQASRALTELAGVADALVAMATPLNLELATGLGFVIPDSAPADLLVAIRAQSADRLTAALSTLAETLSARTFGTATELAPPRTTRAALLDDPAELVLISLPGPYAALEAFDAVEAGRNVMLFSDGVSVADEIALKRAAAEAGVLVMGPDCGTAIVGGVALGFANAVSAGSVGLVAASGTGAQQVSSLLETAGVGVSHLLGLGGRDLGAAVGGLAAEQALRALDQDPTTELIVLVSKPPDPAVADRLATLSAELSTPVLTALLGTGRPDLTAATEAVLTRLGRAIPDWPVVGDPGPPAAPATLRGLFAGGTLAAEALLLTAELGAVSANIGPAARPALEVLADPGSIIVDFGEDELTSGRAHPMIDPTLRLEHLATAGTAVDTVVLLDVVLGYGADPDPAATLAPALRSAAERARANGVALTAVVSLCGTEADPQGWRRQADALAAAGAVVFASNSAAARHAVAMCAGSPADTDGSLRS